MFIAKPLPLTLALAAGAIALTACSPRDTLLEEARGRFQAVEVPTVTDPAKVELGRQLFHETRLSRAGDMSCASCHDIAAFGADGRATSTGFEKQLGDRNAPTVLNAKFHTAQFWDGRAADLSAQAKGPILNPVEMAMVSEQSAVDAIAAVPAYQEAFSRAFPKDPAPISYDNVAKAIAAFEDTLVTPSRFDRFLAGNHGALSTTEREGLKLFMGKGCASCHQGVAVGGGMYAKFGVTAPYANQKDPGRFKVTGKAEDMHVFKVPSLRNITRTGPYFHDGQVAELEQAVAVMAETQLGTKLEASETKSIVAFLGALEGSLTPEMTKVPAPLK